MSEQPNTFESPNQWSQEELSIITALCERSAPDAELIERFDRWAAAAQQEFDKDETGASRLVYSMRYAELCIAAERFDSALDALEALRRLAWREYADVVYGEVMAKMEAIADQLPPGEYDRIMDEVEQRLDEKQSG
jgi:hypothetical protein